MENDDYSSDSEEKMLEYDHIDYSQFLKPKQKATIHIGNNYQAKLPEINEKKNRSDKKEIERNKIEKENENKINKKQKIPKSNTTENIDYQKNENPKYKKRKINN